MPYISPDKRTRLDDVVHQLEAARQLSAGELNYLITKLLLAWLPAEPNYAQYSMARGVLYDVAEELYRRLVVPFEDAKKEQNGDVY